MNRNKDVFYNCVETGLRGFETITKYSGYNIDGLTDELLKDNEFIMDLQMISCEIDMSKYLNPKSSALIKVFKTAYKLNKENEIKSNFNNILNDKDKLDKIKNLN